MSPAGAAVGTPLTDAARRAYFVPAGDDLSPLATAYARARGADRVCSYGDWVALSSTVDVATARLLRREVSDGVIAPGYEPQALEMLRRKRGGRYTVLEIDPEFEPGPLERRDVYGVTFEQHRNSLVPDGSLLDNVVTQRREIPDGARRDMLLAMIVLKYTQSNSVCLVSDGQVIGNGAGQQSRIHCTRLAADKADMWRLRQHPRVLSLPFRADIERVDRDNAIDGFLRLDLTRAEQEVLASAFVDCRVPEPLSASDRRAWLAGLRGVTLGSDAFIPFRDNVDRAQASGVEYIIQPGGALRETDIVAACDQYGIAMVLTGIRLFHH